jgi:predicted Zn-dependent protease
MVNIGKAVLAIALSSASPGTRTTVLDAYGIGTNVGVMLPFSRSHESEADSIGLMLMSLSGYDPNAAIKFWKKIEANAKGKNGPELLATHPGHEKRIERLEAMMPKAMAVYNDVLKNYPMLRRSPERIIK